MGGFWRELLNEIEVELEESNKRPLNVYSESDEPSKNDEMANGRIQQPLL